MHLSSEISDLPPPFQTLRTSILKNSSSQSSSSRSGRDEEGLRDWIVSSSSHEIAGCTRTGWVDRSGWLPRIGRERGVGWVRGADETLGSLDGTVDAERVSKILNAQLGNLAHMLKL